MVCLTPERIHHDRLRRATKALEGTRADLTKLGLQADRFTIPRSSAAPIAVEQCSLVGESRPGQDGRPARLRAVTDLGLSQRPRPSDPPQA